MLAQKLRLAEEKREKEILEEEARVKAAELAKEKAAELAQQKATEIAQSVV